MRACSGIQRACALQVECLRLITCDASCHLLIAVCAVCPLLSETDRQRHNVTRRWAKGTNEGSWLHSEAQAQQAKAQLGHELEQRMEELGRCKQQLYDSRCAHQQLTARSSQQELELGHHLQELDESRHLLQDSRSALEQQELELAQRLRELEACRQLLHDSKSALEQQQAVHATLRSSLQAGEYALEEHAQCQLDSAESACKLRSLGFQLDMTLDQLHAAELEMEDLKASLAASEAGRAQVRLSLERKGEELKQALSAAAAGAAREQALEDVHLALVFETGLCVSLREADASIGRLEAANLEERAEMQELSRSLASSADEAEKMASEVIKLRKQVCVCELCSPHTQ
jgi:chromosome segregation ATPase